MTSFGYEKYIKTDKYVIAPETTYKRETMIDLISKAFAHFLLKTDIKEHIMFKQLRKTFNTSVRMQFGEHAHLITGHEGTAILDKHYVSKSNTQDTMRKAFKIYQKNEIPDSNS